LRKSEIVSRLLPETLAVSLRHRKHTGRWPDLRNPRTFNEKVLHSRLRERDARLPSLIDKALVKEHVRGALGPDWVTPTLFTGATLPPLSERTWPTPFVVKSTHGSGQCRFVLSEADKDWAEIEAAVARWSRNDRWPYYRWPYTEIARGVLVEPFIGIADRPPPDFKFFVFNGDVAVIQVDVDRRTQHRRSFYDRSWRKLDFTMQYPDGGEIERPSALTEMVSGAEALGADFEFVRVDLYQVGGRPRFGEMTFYPESGFCRFKPATIDAEFGALWGSQVSNEPNLARGDRRR
jgi:hypothetical protein